MTTKLTLSRKPKTKQGDPDRLNRERAGWALVALKEFQVVTGADNDNALSDLLCNLMHLDDYSMGGLERWEPALEQARCHYHDETAMENE